MMKFCLCKSVFSISLQMKYVTFLILFLLINHTALGQLMEVHGHRGCRGLLPENTLLGFLHAIDLGVDVLEMDLVVNKDFQIIVSHEAYFNAEISSHPHHTITPSNELEFNIFQMNYADIKAFDVGTKFHPRFPHQKKLKSHKPLFSDLIPLLEQHSKKNIRYNIELKFLDSMEIAFNPSKEDFAALVLRSLRELGIEERTTLQCFDFDCLKVLKKMGFHGNLAALVEFPAPIDSTIDQLGFVPHIISPNFKWIGPEYIQSVQSKGISIIPWTVNTSEDLQRLIEWRVDGIITDYPDLLINLRSNLSK